MNNAKDMLIGFATADALGVPIEFTPRNNDKPLTEMIGYGSHNVPEGTWSDDTSMTIATIDSIVNNEKIDYDDIMNNFVKWVKNSDYTATDKLFDIGNTTSEAIRNYLLGICNSTKCGLDGIRDNGNGSLMRIFPFVLYAYYSNLSEDEIVKLMNDASSLTHAHEISRLGCKIYSDYIFGLLNGLNKEEALDNLGNINYLKYYTEDSVQYYKRILNGSIKNESIDNILSSGFIVHTLEASIWCTLNNESYEDAVIKAINLGDDTDTVGAITGSINGLIYGEDNIPERWTSKLKKREYLEELAYKFDNQLNKRNIKK